MSFFLNNKSVLGRRPKEQCSKASGRKQRKPCHQMSWFYKLAALVGLESSSEETELIFGVRGVPLDVAGKDHSMIYKQVEDA